jgi:N-acetylglucosamine-6-sulfatase
VAAGIGSATATARGHDQKRPNIIVVMTDDETVENMRFTPSIRRLIADQGVTFDNSFVNLSICCPSRATFLTGEYAHNHGVVSNDEPGGGYYKLDNSNTLPVWLQRSGYFTILIGKYLNHYGDRNPTEVPPGWNEWHSPIGDDPYHYYGYTLNENGTLRRYDDTYQTDQLTQEAVSLVRSHAGSDRPFFMWLTYVAPHVGSPQGAPGAGRQHQPLTPLPATRHVGRYSNVPLPMPPSFNEADVSDKPSAIRALPLLTQKDIETMTASYHSRGESLLAVDEGVQKIFDALSAAGALDDTFLVFTSDNGWMQGEHRIPQGKIVPYEPSIRVPLLMRGPGVPAGVHLPQMVVNADLAPTIVALANATPGLTMDGRSLLPLLADRTLWSGRDLLLDGVGADVAHMGFQGLRTPRYVYIEYRLPAETELYDLAKDPYELQNVAKDPAYDRIRAEFAARLAKLRTCRGASCRVQPALKAVVGCSGVDTSVEVAGADAGRLVHVEFSVGGRRVAGDGRAPFRVVTRRRGPIRVLAGLDDGTRMTLERAAPRC